MSSAISKRQVSAGIFISLIALLSALLVGETPLMQMTAGLADRLLGISFAWHPLLDERLPRALALFFGGASLAVAGAVMQALFQSPLATPTLLGSTAGGSLLMIFAIVLQWPLAFAPALTFAACLGSLAALLLVYGIWRCCHPHATSQLVLIGLAVTMLLAALESSLLYALRSDWQLVQLINELTVGSSHTLSWNELHLLLLTSLIGVLGCFYYSKEIDLLSLGDEEAISLGLDLNKVRYRLFLCVSLLTGSTLATIGNIAFFGMLLPCAVRQCYGPLHCYLLPFSALLGGATLLVLDTLLRLTGHQMFNIAQISAFIGSLLFLYLIVFRSK